MPKFNGYKNWNHWNVSLWINNDEGLYQKARSAVMGRSRTAAAVMLIEDLRDHGTTHTPDGAPYSLSSVRAAMVGM